MRDLHDVCSVPQSDIEETVDCLFPKEYWCPQGIPELKQLNGCVDALLDMLRLNQRRLVDLIECFMVEKH